MKQTFCLGLAALAASVAFAKTSTPEGWLDDYDAALARAAAGNRQVLIDFSGSDWCGWCRRLEKEVFATEAFRKAAAERFVLLMVDSPEDESLLSDKAREQNPRLVEKFGVDGFPTVVVLDAKGEEVCRMGYAEGGPEKYLERLDAEIRNAPDVKKYIQPIEKVIQRHDDEFMKAMRAAAEQIESKFPPPEGELSKEERKKLKLEQQKYVQLVFEPITVKFMPLMVQALAEAKAMEVPENVAERKRELIADREETLAQAQEEFKAYEEAKKNGTLDEYLDDGADGDDDEEDEDGNDFGGMAARPRPVFVPPKPEDAHTDAEFFAQVAMPFWRRHLVETFRAPAGMDAKTASRIVKVREALARKLATARDEFPTGDEFNEADSLWNKAKCRDAAVGLVRYLGFDREKKYWQGGKMFNELAAKHDDAAEPMLGFLVRWGHADWTGVRKDMNDSEKKVDFGAIYAARSNAFERVAGFFREADPKIVENLNGVAFVAPGAGRILGCEYLDLLNAGGDDDLLAAIRLKPDCARAMMHLAENYGYDRAGDGAELFSRAASNSLDQATSRISQVLHGQTTRWSGSTAYLYSVASNAASSVRTDSTFAYRATAAALSNIYRWEVEGVPTGTNICAYVIGPGLRDALFGMFDAYIAAGEQPLMPSVDAFRGMAMALAMQLDDWDKVRRYASQIKSSLTSWRDALWLRYAAPNGEYLPQVNMFIALGDRKTREATIRIGEAAHRGNVRAVLEASEKLLKTPKLREEAQVVASRHFFKARKALQEAAGGWVDAMPTPRGFEAEHWWGMVGTGKDGRARIYTKEKKSYYRILMPLPGIGHEYEGTVHFEGKDKKQKYWNIGWGLSHPYVGFCMNSNSWAMPYIRFWRDEAGDHYSVESYTEENIAAAEKSDSSKFQKEYDDGWVPLFVVRKGDLERASSHTFRLVAARERLTIAIDGNEVFSAPMADLMGIGRYQERIRPDGSVYPVWKVFKNTAFSGYRYRRIPEEAK